MGRLAGFKYRQVVKKLKKLGFQFNRQRLRLLKPRNAVPLSNWNSIPVGSAQKAPALTVGQAAGSHEIWYNPKANTYTTIPNHGGDLPEGTLRAILKQAQVDPEQFLNTR
ncbi:MAG: addiction module toxin, HicA family [Cyanobacteria bacterium]|jgi:predicted RNA binding protein YcfA (HicA-like mRNA interferase family)|nr:addiction module toxin, HicA family [Cyanobacteria bacterium GSL.Bin1]